MKYKKILRKCGKTDVEVGVAKMKEEKNCNFSKCLLNFKAHSLQSELNKVRISNLLVQGGIGSGILYNLRTFDLPDILHTNQRVSMKDAKQHCSEDGDMVTFVDDSTSYYGHQDPAEVTSHKQKLPSYREVYSC